MYICNIVQYTYALLLIIIFYLLFDHEHDTFMDNFGQQTRSTSCLSFVITSMHTSGF